MILSPRNTNYSPKWKKLHVFWACSFKHYTKEKFAIAKIARKKYRCIYKEYVFCFKINLYQYQFSHSVMSNSLRSHEPQHARPPCPSPTPRVYPNPCPLSRWCHPAISSSVVPFSFCLQSFPASGSFQMSQLFASGGPSISFSFNISASNAHPGLISFRMDWVGCPRDSWESSTQ